MQKFEFASPTTKEQAVALLADKWGEVEVLADTLRTPAAGPRLFVIKVAADSHAAQPAQRSLRAAAAAG